MHFLGIEPTALVLLAHAATVWATVKLCLCAF